MPDSLGKEAVVVGAGIGGLAAAKVLSGHFDNVTVLDRDTLPDQPEPRSGTPQARHGHGLLGSGQACLAELFPGFTQQLEDAGAVRARAGLDIWWERPGFDPFPLRDLGFDSFFMSRSLLEFVVRQCLERQPNVTLRPKCRVTEFVTSPNRNVITAVRFQNAGGKPETLNTDLVIDSSGRGALTMDTLQHLRAPAPPQTEIGIDINYASVIFAVPDDAPMPWKGLMHVGTPDAPRGGLVFPIEHRQWMISLGGVHGDIPPGDLEGFTEFARSFRTPTVYNAIRSAKPMTEVARFTTPGSFRRHFDRMSNFPSGLLPLGDAICRFNPLYGQGMSVAAQEACALHDVLATQVRTADPLGSLAAAYFNRIKNLLDAPWGTAEIDMVFPQTRGERPADFERRMEYGKALRQLAAEDPEVHRLLAEVSGLQKPPSVLSEPKLAERVMRLMQAAA
jgi:2-polyprenyl-6-methoxyphenol hydroxylase-like FAD-dependent oxidoreductase